MSSSLWRWKNCGVSILNLKFFHCSFFSLMLRETFNMKYNFNKNDLLIPFVSDLFAERKGYLQFVQYMGHHFIHKYTKHSLKKVPNQLSTPFFETYKIQKRTRLRHAFTMTFTPGPVIKHTPSR